MVRLRVARDRLPARLAVGLTLLLAVLAGGPAAAHDESDVVRSTTPSDGQEVEESPAVVIVEFTFDVAADFVLEVTGEDGVDHIASVQLRDPQTLVGELGPLPRPGIYSATYDVGYADQPGHHRQVGHFSFVYAPPGSDPFGGDPVGGPAAEPGAPPPPPDGAAANPDTEPADDDDEDVHNPRPGDLADGFVAAVARERSQAERPGWWSRLDPVQRTATVLVGGALLLVVGALERWTRPNR